jgi:hypothetical protein
VSDDQSPLEPRVVALMREKAAPSAEVRARVRAKLAMAVPAMGGPFSGEGGGSAGGTGGLTGVGGWGTHALAIAAFVVGGGTGAALYAALSRPPPPAIVYVDRPATQTPASSVASEPVRSTATAEEMPSAPHAAAIPAQAVAPPRSSQLAAERDILDDARAALVQGAPERSIDRLDRHRRAFPHPLLGEERDAMWVEALVRVGRYDEARGRADAFRRRWPGSLFLSTVDSAVASIP